MRRLTVLAVMTLSLVLAPLLTLSSAKAEPSELLDAIDLGFYVDTTYQYSSADTDDELGFRTLYPDNKEFNINAFTLSLSKTPTMEGGAMDLLGFRADVLFGEQAPLLSSVGLDDSKVVDPYQAYLQFMVPTGDGLNIYAGKFVTLAGFEVIEAKNNPNISRSILFGYAIPFTHTGIRADFTTGPLTFTAGVNNGWDQVKDDNDNVTFEGQVAFSHSGGSISDMWVGVTGYLGKETGITLAKKATNGSRKLITAVGSLTLMDRITFIVDADFGWQEDGVLKRNNKPVEASWWGVAGYAVLDVTPSLTLAVRGEYFEDKEGFRTIEEDKEGFRPIGTQELKEFATTLSVKPFASIGGNEALDNLELRTELRWDSSNITSFVDEDGKATKDQFGIMGQLLYWIEI